MSIREVIKLFNPSINYAPETCAKCNGTGSHGGGHGNCSPCGGQGSVLVAQPSRRCAKCNGTGSHGGGHGNCSPCGGTGWAHAMK